MTSTVFSFNEQLAMSQNAEVHALVKQIMFDKFEGELLAIHTSYKENDKLGSEYALEFHNGKFEHLDIKVRSRDYYNEANKCNIALETRTGSKACWTLGVSKIKIGYCLFI